MLHFRSGCYEFAVLNSFGSDQFAGNFMDLIRTTSNHDDFQAIVRVEMNMQAGIDHDTGAMLHVGQDITQVVSSMIV